MGTAVVAFMTQRSCPLNKWTVRKTRVIQPWLNEFTLSQCNPQTSDQGPLASEAGASLLTSAVITDLKGQPVYCFITQWVSWSNWEQCGDLVEVGLLHCGIGGWDGWGFSSIEACTTDMAQQKDTSLALSKLDKPDADFFPCNHICKIDGNVDLTQPNSDSKRLFTCVQLDCGKIFSKQSSCLPPNASEEAPSAAYFLPFLHLIMGPGVNWEGPFPPASAHRTLWATSAILLLT